MRVAIACGGTGGHVLPGIAVGMALRARGHDVTLWLAGKAVEAGAVAGWNGNVESVRVAGFGDSSLFRNVGSAVALARAFFECRKRMRGQVPDVLLAMGSYASVGPALAARSLGVPIVLHEANAIPGRALTMLAPLASAIATSFPPQGWMVHNSKVRCTGFPVRPEIESLATVSERSFADFVVLVMGGSQGARVLNETAPPAMALARSRGVPLRVVHLSGTAWADKVRNEYSALGVPAVVHGFLQDMCTVYREAVLAVARAGAGTCSELAMAGLPALLVPLPWAARDHQTRNALVMEREGAADLMPQSRLTVETLAEYVVNLYKNPDKMSRMISAMKRLAVPGAAQRIAELVENVGHGRDTRRLVHADV